MAEGALAVSSKDGGGGTKLSLTNTDSTERISKADETGPLLDQNKHNSEANHVNESSAKIPLKRASFNITRQSFRLKRKELKKHLTVMATAKFGEKEKTPTSTVVASSNISTNVPLDENQIVISTSAASEKSATLPASHGADSQLINGGNTRPMSRTDSVRNFFNKVVNQIAVSSSKVQVKIGRGGSGASEAESKADAAQRRRAEEWRLYFEETQGRVPGVIGRFHWSFLGVIMSYTYS